MIYKKHNVSKLGWFHVRKFIYVTKQINRLKKKNISRKFDKIQYLFMIFLNKISKLGTGKNLLNLIF